MFVYEKKLQYPVRIKNTNPALAKFIITQYGGPDGELGASLRYLSQRYAMPYPELAAYAMPFDELKGLLTDIGTEELGHLEMIGAIVYQLTRNMTPEQIRKAGFDTYFVDHTAGIYPQFASGTPWTAATIAVKGDVITDLSEDMARRAEGTDNVRQHPASVRRSGRQRRHPLPARPRGRALPALWRSAAPGNGKDGSEECLRRQSCL